MIKVANNIQRMLAKQAYATPVKFVNHSTDPMRPAFAPEGELPQSYFDDEAMMQDRERMGRHDKRLDMPLSSLLSPRDFTMLLNTSLGQQNSGGSGERIFTHGAYGPSRVSYNSPFGHISSRTTPFGFGHLYDMSPNQIEKNPQTNFLR